jgi:Brp/Blh family beta-carotene 15,15'-monooxygenase
LIALLPVGIAHGALDHLVGLELRSKAAIGLVSIEGPCFYAAYIAAAAAVLGLWFLAPVAASVGFLAIAAFHFGQGDVYWSRRFGLAARIDSVGYRLSLMAARSALPIVMPLAAWPDVFSDVAGAVANRLFGRSNWTVPIRMIECGWIALFIVVCMQMLWSARFLLSSHAAIRRAAAADFAETALLVATFAFIPPVLALGVYFHAWHSLRHIARLLLITKSTRRFIASGRWAAAVWEFQWTALPMTCGALAMALGLAFVLGRSLISVVDLGALALVALSALTLPHVLVVSGMDARQDVWSTGSGRNS